MLDAIRLNLVLAGVGMADFVEEVKKHTQNQWRNPPGFLRALSQHFHAKTLPAGRPVTAAEAAAREKIWMSMFTPQRGHDSPECLSAAWGHEFVQEQDAQHGGEHVGRGRSRHHVAQIRPAQ